ncbi:hypothetical protein FSP39_020535, partial [Pinctada imbricata]
KTNDECCFCDCVQEWEISGTEVNELLIEYSNLNGSSVLLYSTSDYNSSLQSSVSHTLGKMSMLPCNVCDFIEIVRMIFSRNDIATIPDISCLMDIEKIDLSYNKLRFISNQTFGGLRKLRNLDLSFNEISQIDPNAFQGKFMAIFNINLSNIKIKKIDVSNLLFQKGFCKVNYDNNQVRKISNPSGFKIEAGKAYGKGRLLSINNCSLTQFINYSDIGLNDFTEYYKVFNYSFDTEGTEIGCDCILYPFLERQFDELERSWITLQRHSNLSCSSPESLKNTTIVDIVKNKSLREKMTCEKKEHCPKKCTCYVQPTYHHLVVNCSNVGLETFPKSLPWYSNITLLMDGNDLRSLPDAAFLHRVHYLDLSGNKIVKLNEAAINSLSQNIRLDLSGNLVSYLPRQLASKTTVLGILDLNCDCKMAWIIDWIFYYVRNNDTIIFCLNYAGKGLQEVSHKIKKVCRTTETYSSIWISIIVASVFIAIIIILSIIFIFCQPEVLILYRTYFKRYTKSYYPEERLAHDVYICMDDGDESVRDWVLIKLLSEIEEKGMSVFIPCKDELVGHRIEEARCAEIDTCRSFIIILSKKEFGYNDGNGVECAVLQLELNRIWHNFRKDSQKKVLVVNFDNLAVSDVRNRFCRAFLRTRVDINVTSRHQKALNRIIETLPPNTCNVSTRRTAWISKKYE